MKDKFEASILRSSSTGDMYYASATDDNHENYGIEQTPPLYHSTEAMPNSNDADQFSVLPYRFSFYNIGILLNKKGIFKGVKYIRFENENSRANYKITASAEELLEEYFHNDKKE